MIICRWIGVLVVKHNNFIVHFDAFSEVVQRKKGTQAGLRSIWFACMWSIWKARNAKIFQGKQ
jgi:hypothetical protein